MIQEFIDSGLYPGIGYDTEHWTVWVFLSRTPTNLMNREEAKGTTAYDALVCLRATLIKKGLMNGNN